jgi:hypothetical protein
MLVIMLKTLKKIVEYEGIHPLLAKNVTAVVTMNPMIVEDIAFNKPDFSFFIYSSKH